MLGGGANLQLEARHTIFLLINRPNYCGMYKLINKSLRALSCHDLLLPSNLSSRQQTETEWPRNLTLQPPLKVYQIAIVSKSSHAI